MASVPMGNSVECQFTGMIAKHLGDARSASREAMCKPGVPTGLLAAGVCDAPDAA